MVHSHKLGKCWLGQVFLWCLEEGRGLACREWSVLQSSPSQPLLLTWGNTIQAAALLFQSEKWKTKDIKSFYTYVIDSPDKKTSTTEWSKRKVLSDISHTNILPNMVLTHWVFWSHWFADTQTLESICAMSHSITTLWIWMLMNGFTSICFFLRITIKIRKTSTVLVCFQFSHTDAIMLSVSYLYYLTAELWPETWAALNCCGSHFGSVHLHQGAAHGWSTYI